MLNAQQHLPVRPNGHQLENTWWVCIKDTELFFHRLNMHKGSHLLPQQFWSQLTLMCVSWRIKSQVLYKCKVLSANTGHHSETDCTALECGLVFLCALSCTQETTPDLLFIKHRPRFIWTECTHGEKEDEDEDSRAHLFLNYSERPVKTDSRFSLHAQRLLHCQQLALRSADCAGSTNMLFRRVSSVTNNSTEN